MVGIYYIATDKYTEFFEGFIDTLPRFMEGTKKVVSLIADDALAKYDGYKSGDIEVQYHHINHYPWPTITLYKFYLMKQYKVEGAEKHFYFNANIEFTEHCIGFDYSMFNSDIVLSSHCYYETTNTDYVQAGVICLSETVFDKFCEEHMRRTNKYVNDEYKIPIWHDETVLNEILITDHIFDYKIFYCEGIRWMGCDESPSPNICLCYLRKNKFKVIDYGEKKVVGVALSGGFGNQLFTMGSVIAKHGLYCKYYLVNPCKELVDMLKHKSINVTTQHCRCDVFERGYYQNRYEQDICLLRKLYAIPTEINDVIRKVIPDIDNSVVCHVRRGDYLRDGNEILYNVIDNEYIQTVYKKHFEGKKLYIVSDDTEWCRKNIPNGTVINSTNLLFDFACLCIAGGIIASASTFSIMACYLNNCKSVIPYPLFKTDIGEFGIIEDNIVPKWCIRENIK